MAIEFECGNCKTVLRTGNETAGKTARCPNCSNLIPIPMATSDPRYSSMPSTQMPSAKPDQQTSSYPFRNENGTPPESSNPYAPINASYESSRRTQSDAAIARSRLLPPVVTVLVFVSFLFVISVLGLFGELGNGTIRIEELGGIAIVLAFVLVNLVAILGCVSLLNFRYRSFGIIGLVCAILSSLYCCFIPAGFAIWGIVVVNDPAVYRHFR